MRPSFELLAAGGVAAVLAAITVTSTPGIESAAALGVLLPPVVAGAAAHRVARERARATHEPLRSVVGAIVRAALAFLVAFAIAGVRLGFDPACADASGLAWLALGPLPGMLLAALVGELVGRRVARPRLAAGLAALVPIAALVVVAIEIYATPAVYAFTVFGGHWPGPIYDESRGLPDALLSYRLVTALGAAGLAAALVAPAPALARVRLGLRLVSLACLTGFVVATYRGESLGHRTSVARIDDALGGRIAGPRCTVHLPSETPWRERRRILAECEAHVVDIERILRIRRAEPLEAFVYRSSEEKAELVGAGDTYVAKPWRGEIHVQRESFPHAVMRHEIVHVIAGEYGPWPFRTSGALGGLWMNPGLVEGIAVAIAWEPRDDLSPDEWSAAMLSLGRLPRAADLFGAGFLGQGASASYAAAGSFVAHLLRTRGARAVGAMYLRGSVGDAAAIAREEAAWHEHLRRSLGSVSARALALVRVRLLDRGLLSTRCGRLRARISERMVGASQRRDYAAALRRCAELAAIDPRDAIVRVNHAVLLARSGRVDDAERELRAMPDDEVPGALRARLLTVLGDVIVRRRGDSSRARAHYLAALAIPQDEDLARALEVRVHALGLDEPARSTILDAVADPGDEPRSEVELGARLALLALYAADGLPSYLLARRLVNEGRPLEARRMLARSYASGPMPTERTRLARDRLDEVLLVEAALGRDAEARAELIARHAAGRDVDPALAPFVRYAGREP